ncbi:MAG: BatD family protein [Candidatus Azobacteroides sp.]|nr:BatD family protein [Candidatus Azobacteroides sp.]
MKTTFLLIALLLYNAKSIASTVPADDVTNTVTFIAKIDETVVVGQKFRISYTLTTETENGKSIRVPDSKDFYTISSPKLVSRATSTIPVNGKAVTQTTNVYRYILSAKKRGTFTIPAATIQVGNNEYKSNELVIKVLSPNQVPNSALSSADSIFVAVNVSKNPVCEKEEFSVTFKLYTLFDVRNFERAKFPDFEGFISHETDLEENAQWNLESYKDHNYHTIIIKQTTLIPQRSGKITIGQGKFDFIIHVQPCQNERNNLDDYFDSSLNVKKTITSEPITINVKSCSF